MFYDEDDRGRAIDAHVGVIGACSKPRRLREVEAAINGQIVGAEVIARAAAACAEAVDPFDDIHASAKYRRALAATLVERALLQASA